MKPTMPYRMRRDRMLKKHSTLSLYRNLCNVAKQNALIPPEKRGRPCVVKKHKQVCFILLWKIYNEVLEKMELDSEVYLGRHYDHSNFAYHYKRLDPEIIEKFTWLYERLIMQMLENEIMLHILDSTAISTSVREERTVQGLRNKQKLTQKLHTLIGYDPPLQIVVVEGAKSTTHHVSDSQGGLLMLKEGLKGYCLGDRAYETYELVQAAEDAGLMPVYKPKDKQRVRKTLSAKKRRRDNWSGNPQRLCREFRGTGEVLYGAATRAGLIHSQCRLVPNQHKDALIIGLRQNLLTYLRLEAPVWGIIRKTLKAVSPIRK
jgi:hypothetical protein